MTNITPVTRKALRDVTHPFRGVTPVTHADPESGPSTRKAVQQENDQLGRVTEPDDMEPPDWIGYLADDQESKDLSREFFIDDEGNLIQIGGSA